MEKKEKSAQQIQKQKFYLIVPLIILPFLTLLFWSVGGGSAAETNGKPSKKDGLNTSLPDAYIKKNDNPDKMSYYELAKTDSVTLRGRIASDPYAKKDIGNTLVRPVNAGEHELSAVYSSSGHLNTSLKSGVAVQDKNETRVYQKLEQLNNALNTQNATRPFREELPRSANTGVTGSDIDRLEKMMKSMGQKDGDDPELQQINGMLEKILDVQHPDRVQEKIRETSEKKRGQVFAVSPALRTDQISLFSGGNNQLISPLMQNAAQGNQFFWLEDTPASGTSENAITAVVHDDQVLVNGSTVKLRLTTDIYINGVLIPKDTFLFGLASLTGDRLNVTINSLQYQNSLFPVSLSIFDIDGLAGIYIPDAISRNVAKQSADQAINSFGMTSFDPSLGAQAASAGIQAARSMISKNVRLIKVTVKAGYQVLLRDSQGK